MTEQRTRDAAIEESEASRSPASRELGLGSSRVLLSGPREQVARVASRQRRREEEHLANVRRTMTMMM